MTADTAPAVLSPETPCTMNFPMLNYYPQKNAHQTSRLLWKKDLRCLAWNTPVISKIAT